MNLRFLRKRPILQIPGVSVVPVFFVLILIVQIADGVLAYIFPIVVETSVKSNTTMGLIMAIASIVGLTCDFLFPSLISQKNWKQLLLIYIFIALLFPLFTYFGVLFEIIGFFIMASMAWGMYFVFLEFSQQNYIVSTGETHNFSKGWSLLALLLSIVAVITPILGSSLLRLGDIVYTVFAVVLLSLSLLILLLSGPIRKSHRPARVRSASKELLKLIEEFRVWKILSGSIWQVLGVSLVLQCIFTAYSVFAGLFGRELIGKEGFDWVIMFMFAVPGLIASLLLSRIPVKQHKKRYTHICLIVGGLLLTLLMFFEEQKYIVGFIILSSSFMFALAGPLNNAVFSDFASRLREEKAYLFGMVNATGSLAFIIVPILLGILSDKYGYYVSFAFMGVVAFLMGTVLLFTTPKKIYLPQKELNGINQETIE